MSMKFMNIAGAVLAVVSVALLLLARLQLGKSFALTPQAKELVTHGLYSRIRNPMYLFLDLALAGVGLAASSWYPLLPLIVLVPLQVRNARREAALLQEKFGTGYVEYRRTTWC